MKIGSFDNSKPVAPAPAPERKTGAAGGGPAVESSAQVALSKTASELAAPPGDAAFDGAKVERIAQAIRDGQFKVDPEAIADKLIANAHELLTRKPN